MTKHLALDQPSPWILKPWSSKEAMSVSAAAAFLGISEAHMRRLAARCDLGTKLPGTGEWRISRVALRMWAERDHTALRCYLEGDRSSPIVRSYFAREGIMCEALPQPGDRQSVDARRVGG